MISLDFSHFSFISEGDRNCQLSIVNCQFFIAPALFGDNCQNFIGAAFRVVIDNHMVIPEPLLHLPDRPLHAQLDLILRGIAPAPEPAFQLLHRGGHNEDQLRVRHALPNLFRTRRLNIQQHGAVGPLLLRLGTGGAIVIGGVGYKFEVKK